MLNKKLNKSLRSLFALLVLLMGVGFSTTALAADEQSSKQQAVTENPADLWRAVKAGEPGFTTYNSLESDVLINVVGNDGRLVRDTYVKPAIALSVVGVFGAFLLFYLVNGPSKLEKGFSGRMLERWDKSDIWLHWVMAVACLILMVTGIFLLLGRHFLAPYIGEGTWGAIIITCKFIHDWVGPVFIVSWLLSVIKWMPLQTFKLYDLKWFLVVGGYINFGPFKGKHPDSGFANAGEKMWFWALAIFGLFVSVSGLMLVFPNLDLPRVASMAALLIHAGSAVILIAFTIVHIWMATVLSEGGMECMVSGYCDENWAKQHHNLWYDEIKANGTLKYQDD
ncbi:formate dehydrogenase subunit gamma [Shewanella intestini]|uniref:Formate dehydrogenase subunit gamma n=1 Tax=Shewanella intestini TaxID=2017544 RepID=A0ABS5I5L5_9GAMM|nr:MULTISPECIES: formate dehydrogenase subunit gamma [Shewanella]MBR9729312.1 formate dehydrogenase subunit gamma [Shewanella intestini]MRG37391.1 formate dehydrogenase subunit gamma [Shewanella sp. XMDDZSB0408]